MNGEDLSAEYTRDDNELIKMQEDFRGEGHYVCFEARVECNAHSQPTVLHHAL